MKNILRNLNFGFKNRIMGMALLRSEPCRLNRSFGGLRAGMVFAAFMTFAAPVSRAALSAGDIAFVMYNADATPDTIAFVALVDIPAGEEIKFTDNGWTSSNTWRTSEGIFTYTAPAGGVSKGSVVTVSLSGLTFSTSGDQIIAYQGDSTMIAALNNEGAGVWQANATSSSTSALPQGLVNGTTAVALNEVDNAIYNGTLSGTKEELLAAINNNANWTGDNSTVYTWTRGSFTVGAASDPSITTTGTLNSFTATAGIASTAQTFSVTSSNLTADITVTAPTDFEVASDGATFGNTATINQNGGSASGTVSVRVAASASAGVISGNVTLASTTASRSVAVSGFVSGPVALPYGPETFETSQGQWLSHSSSSTKNWSRVLLGTDYVMQMNGYDSTDGAPAANDWLILGPINVPSGISALVANFNIQKVFTSGEDSEFNLKVSSNYSGSGDPTSATWDTVNFTKPLAQTTSSTTMDASGNVVLPSSLHGQSAVYVAFHLEATGATSTSRWSIDDFALTTTTVPPLSFTGMPASIDEGVELTIGTISIPSVLSTDLNVIVTSSLPSALTVDGGDGASESTTVTIFAGDTSSTFFISTIRDFEATADRNATLTASADGYQVTTSLVTIKNLDLPSTSLGASGYTQAFTDYAAATPTLPLGWSVSGSNTTFPAADADWGQGSSAGLRGGANVLGYQHSGSTGIFKKILTLKNETGAVITDLTVSYKGRVERAAEQRFPAYVVALNGVAVPALAYSTADGDNVTRVASITGLSVGVGATFEIVWESDGSTVGSPGSGSRRQIGISEVSVTLGATSTAPTLSGLSIPIINVTRTQAEASANVTTDGGAAITKRGFVIAVTSANPNPEIGGTGVTNVEDAGTEVGLMTATFTGLSVETGYTVKAYAINSVGTSYTAAQSFTTVGSALSFTGTYSESFDSYTGTVPAGWHAVSSTGVQVYGGEWGSGSTGGFRGAGATTGGVLGYQPTTTTGDLTVTLTLVNNTGETIETLNIGYLGRVARVDQTRISSWAVTLNGQAVEDLAYSTDNTSGEAGAPGDETKTTQLTGLSITNGTEFTLTWTSPNPTGSGASRQIGLADFVVSTSALTPAAPSNLSYTPSTISGTVEVAISSLTPTVTGTVDTYSVSPALPSGLSINATSGVISGTPTAIAASATYTVTAANEGGSTTATVTVTVNSAPVGSTYSEWLNGATPSNAAFLDYVFGAVTPGTLDPSLKPTVAVTDGNLVLTYYVRQGTSGLTVTPKTSADLAAGPSGWVTDGVTDIAVGTPITVNSVSVQQRTASVPVSGAKKFLRVEAVQQ